LGEFEFVSLSLFSQQINLYMMSSAIKDLKKVIALSDLTDEQLQWIADRVEFHEFNDGSVLVKTGEPVDVMWFLPEGRIEFYMDINGQQVLYTTSQNDSDSGGVTGVLPYSRMKTSPGYAYSVGKTKGYSLHKKYFQELEQLNPALIQRLISYMTERARKFATIQLQHEKVSALGKLSAVIAHEMNNPASAINRISSLLSKRVRENYFLTEKLLRNKVDPDHILNILVKVDEKARMNKGKLSPLEKMQREDEINRWLEQNGFQGNGIAAETFADSGFTEADLDNIRSGVDNKAFFHVLHWVENLLVSQIFIKDMEEASMRISNLVTAIKSHVHMDQTNELQPTNINHDIDNTLTLLEYKLHEKNVEIKKLFEENLPEVPAYIGELNQVWINIIDNAIYALPEGGELTIETTKDALFSIVKIIDNGLGIPQDIINRIFDPFFTTKKVGEGIGIGLDLVKRIIDHHNGEIKVNSKPGRTEFTVCIPYGKI
jgi:signal transduction histidine kinase